MRSESSRSGTSYFQCGSWLSVEEASAEISFFVLKFCSAGDSRYESVPQNKDLVAASKIDSFDDLFRTHSKIDTTEQHEVTLECFHRALAASEGQRRQDVEVVKVEKVRQLVQQRKERERSADSKSTTTKQTKSESNKMRTSSHDKTDAKKSKSAVTRDEATVTKTLAEEVIRGEAEATVTAQAHVEEEARLKVEKVKELTEEEIRIEKATETAEAEKDAHLEVEVEQADKVTREKKRAVKETILSEQQSRQKAESRVVTDGEAEIENEVCLKAEVGKAVPKAGTEAKEETEAYQKVRTVLTVVDEKTNPEKKTHLTADTRVVAVEKSKKEKGACIKPNAITGTTNKTNNEASQKNLKAQMAILDKAKTEHGSYQQSDTAAAAIAKAGEKK